MHEGYSPSSRLAIACPLYFQDTSKQLKSLIMAQAVEVYSFNINAGESIQLWIHGYDQQTYVGFDLKPELVVTGEQNGQPVFTGEQLFLAYNVVGVGEHVDA